MTEQEGYIVINMLSGIGPARMNILMTRYGNPCDILSAPEKELAVLPGMGRILAEKLANWEKYTDLEKELLIAEKSGVKIVTQADENYPSALRELRDDPDRRCNQQKPQNGESLHRMLNLRN